MIIAAINHWFTSRKVPHRADLCGLPVHMHATKHTAIWEQYLIGWEPAVKKGFLSSVWHSLASLQMDNLLSTNWALGTQHMQAILKALHSLTSNLWKACNLVIHNKDKHKKVTRCPAEQVEIQHYCNNRHLLAPCSRSNYCNQPINTILNSTQSVCRRWLRQVQCSWATWLHDNALLQQTLPRRTTSMIAPVSGQAPAQVAMHPDLPPPAAPPHLRCSISFGISLYDKSDTIYRLSDIYRSMPACNMIWPRQGTKLAAAKASSMLISFIICCFSLIC